jgi:hypothetical protein
MNDLKAVLELLHVASDPMPGSLLRPDDAAAYVRKQFPGQAYCLVRDWIWLDLLVEDKHRLALATTDRLPVMLYAHCVIEDSAGRWAPGDFVRTSLLHRFEHEFLFRTQQTLYVLLGTGTRKLVSPETVMQIV